MEIFSANIVNGNVSIAKFMGFKMKPVRGKNKDYEYEYWCFDPASPVPVKKDVFFGTLKDTPYEDMFLQQIIRFGEYPFHKDWNWLMPVIEKCKFTDKLAYKGSSIEYALSTLQIEAVWNACVAFIKWYNKEK
jgi:hypothetical protein